MPASKGREQTAFRLTRDGRNLLEKLAKKLGLSMAGVIEVAIREAAAKRKIT